MFSTTERGRRTALFLAGVLAAAFLTANANPIDIPNLFERVNSGDEKALRLLLEHKKEALAFLSSKNTTAKLEKLLPSLGADFYEERERATKEIMRMPPTVVPAIEKFMRDNRGDPEIAYRCRLILKHLRKMKKPLQWKNPLIARFIVETGESAPIDSGAFDIPFHSYLVSTYMKCYAAPPTISEGQLEAVSKALKLLLKSERGVRILTKWIADGEIGQHIHGLYGAVSIGVILDNANTDQLASIIPALVKHANNFRMSASFARHSKAFENGVAKKLAERFLETLPPELCAPSIDALPKKTLAPPKGEMDRLWLEKLKKAPQAKRKYMLPLAPLLNISVATALRVLEEESPKQSPLSEEAVECLTRLLGSTEGKELESVAKFVFERFDGPSRKALSIIPILDKLIDLRPEFAPSAMKAISEELSSPDKRRARGVSSAMLDFSNDLILGARSEHLAEFMEKHWRTSLELLESAKTEEEKLNLAPLAAFCAISKEAMRRNGDAIRRHLKELHGIFMAKNDYPGFISLALFAAKLPPEICGEALMAHLLRKKQYYGIEHKLDLLDERYAFLIPKLIEEMESLPENKTDRFRILFKMAAKIAPRDPRLLDLAWETILSASRKKAAAIMRSLPDGLPKPLREIPGKRLDEFLPNENGNSGPTYALVSVATKKPDDATALVEYITPKLRTVIEKLSSASFYGFDALLLKSPENQEKWADTIFEVLENEKGATWKNALTLLSYCPEAATKRITRLERLLETQRRFFDANPFETLELLARIGQPAAKLAYFPRQFKHCHYADMCLANISPDPAERKKHLMILINDRGTDRGGEDPSSLWKIRSVRGQSEIRTPFFVSIVEHALSQTPMKSDGSPPSEYDVHFALWGLADIKGDEDLTLAECRKILKRLGDDLHLPGSPYIAETALWILAERYPERLEELAPLIESLPIQCKATLGYRKAIRTMKKRSENR